MPIQGDRHFSRRGTHYRGGTVRRLKITAVGDGSAPPRMSAGESDRESGMASGESESEHLTYLPDGGTCAACRAAKVKCKQAATTAGDRTRVPVSRLAEKAPETGGDGRPAAARNAVKCQRCQRLSLVCVPTPPSRRGRPGERRGKRRRVSTTLSVALDGLPVAVEEDVLGAVAAAGLTRVSTNGATGQRTFGVGRYAHVGHTGRRGDGVLWRIPLLRGRQCHCRFGSGH